MPMNRITSRRNTPRRRGAFRLLRCVAFVVCTGLLVSWILPAMTEATWTQTEAAQAQFSAASLPTPSELECGTESGGLLGADKAHISWNMSAPLPAGAKYEVVMQKSGGAEGALPLQPERQITIVPELLDSLIGLVLNLRSPPAEYSVKVSVVYPGTKWRSEPSAQQTVRYTGALLGLLGGFHCLP